MKNKHRNPLTHAPTIAQVLDNNPGLAAEVGVFAYKLSDEDWAVLEKLFLLKRKGD